MSDLTPLARLLEYHDERTSTYESNAEALVADPALLDALAAAGVLREERPVPYEPVRRYVTPWQDTPTPGVEWTAAEREAVTDICTHEGLGKACDRCRDTIFDALTALAPFVAKRERQAAARALYRGYDARRRELPVNPATDWKEGKPA